jgi:hypothetical protein
MEKYKPLYHWLVKVVISNSKHVSNREIHTESCICPLETYLLLEIIPFTSQWYRGLYFSIGNMSTTGNNYSHQSMIQRFVFLLWKQSFPVVDMFPKEKYKPLYHWLVKVIISSSRHVFNGEIQTFVSLIDESNYFQ